MLCLIILLTAACAEDPDTHDPEIPHDNYDTEKYDMQKFLMPIWEGSTAIAEPAFVIAGKDGSMPVIKMLYPIEEVISVRNYGLDIEYCSGIDYILNEGKLEILDTGNIAPINYSDFYFDKYINNGTMWPTVISPGAQLKTEAEKIYQCSGLTQWQIAVTYRHNGIWQGETPVAGSDLFDPVFQKLSNGGSLNMVCLGDSISAGWTASGYEWVNLKPYMPKYFDMVTDYIKDKYSSFSVFSKNLSVGGKTAEWGSEFAQLDDVKKNNPDILIIAFGMNDGASVTDNVNAFYNSTKAIINAARSKKPDCAIVLVSSMLPNADVGYGQGISILQQHRKYPAVLYQLENEYTGVAVADITEMHKTLLQEKTFQDMSSNNINHPNDYVQRLYAQVILRVMGIL